MTRADTGRQGHLSPGRFRYTAELPPMVGVTPGVSVAPSGFAQKPGDRDGFQGPQSMPFPTVETNGGTGVAPRIGLPPNVAWRGTAARFRNATTGASRGHAKQRDDQCVADIRHHPVSSSVRRLTRLLRRIRRASRSRVSAGSNAAELPAGFEEDLNSPLSISDRRSLNRRIGHHSVAQGTSPGKDSICRPPAARHGLSTAGRMLLIATLISGLEPISARAESAATPFRLLGAIERCGTVFERSSSSGYRCAVGDLGGILLDKAGVLVERHGRAAFGDEFRLVNGLSWAPGGGRGLLGTVDAVIPLSHTADFAQESAEGHLEITSATFVQQGLTRWVDEDGHRRNDVRYGVTYRFRLPARETDVFGLSLFSQENLERGHRRLVTGVDYLGRWGRGSLMHFTPMTDWRVDRPGYEKRPLGGTEIGLRLDLTPTLALDTALVRWNNGVESRTDLDGRAGVSVRPHPWLSFVLEMDNIGSGEEATSALATLRIPFGGRTTKLPRWRGLGLADGPAFHGDTPDIWRPVDNLSELQLVERAVQPSLNAVDADEISVRVLQNNVPNGGELDVEVSLSAPALEDTVVLIHLIPGGENPAVPGVDFEDEPVAVTILQGEESARTFISLPASPNTGTPRSLYVEATLAI